MLKIYNKSAITRQQRFSNALVTGLLAAVCCIAVVYLLFHFVRFFHEVLYIVAGYLIGNVIYNYGKGVQVQFSVLAAVLTLAVIIICDMVIMGGLFAFRIYFASSSLDGLFFIGYRVMACVAAWKSARVVG